MTDHTKEALEDMGLSVGSVTTDRVEADQPLACAYDGDHLVAKVYEKWACEPLRKAGLQIVRVKDD